MEIIRRRKKSPETRRLVDLRNNLSKPGTLRRRYDPHTQRTIFAPTRPNKRSREEIAEIDAELIQRTNRLGGGYHPLTEETGEPQNTEEGEIEPEQPETEEDSLILRGDNLPIVEQVQHRGKRGPLYSDKSYCGKVIRKQKDNRRHNKEGLIRIHDGPEDPHSKNSHRSRTHKS